MLKTRVQSGCVQLATRFANLRDGEETRDNNVMHAKPDLRVFLKWKIAGSGSVITDVIQRGFQSKIERNEEILDSNATDCDRFSIDMARCCAPDSDFQS